jgi:predicted ATP-dependent endonuclease of OLD family
MIRSIEITNFRGIQSGKLEDFTPLTILVGPNGCGKSTIIDALLLGAHPTPKEALEYVLNRRKVLEKTRWLLWRAENAKIARIKVVTLAKDERTLRLQRLPGRNGVQCNVEEWSGNEIQSVLAGWASEDGSLREIDYTKSLEDVKSVHIVEHELENERTPLHTLFTQALKEGRRNEALAILNEVVPGLDHIEILTELDKPTIWLVYPNYAIPATLAGDGIQSLLRLSLELVACTAGVVLMEEPEVHQHPRAILQSAKAIWAAVRRNIQVVISTHSLELIDALLSERRDESELEKLSLFSLKLEDGCLKSGRLDGEDIALMRTQIESDLR